MQIYAVLRNLVFSTRMLYNTSEHICLIGGRVCNPRQQETQANLGATRPRVGIANLGLDAPSWQYMNRTYSGIADAATRPPQVNLRFWSSHTKNH